MNGKLWIDGDEELLEDTNRLGMYAFKDYNWKGSTRKGFVVFVPDFLDDEAHLGIMHKMKDVIENILDIKEVIKH